MLPDHQQPHICRIPISYIHTHVNCGVRSETGIRLLHVGLRRHPPPTHTHGGGPVQKVLVVLNPRFAADFVVDLRESFLAVEFLAHLVIEAVVKHLVELLASQE